MNRDQAIALGLIKIPEQPLPELYWQQCARKIAHQDWDEAFEHALNLAVSSPVKDKKISVYCCPWGKHFHVGHKPMIDWSSYVPRKDYDTLNSTLTTVRAQLISITADRNSWRNMYEKKCNDHTALLRHRATPKPTPIDKYPKINKVLAKFNVKLV